ncbi:MAG: PD-(D/E)XK nuclease family protein [Firmicutes bacterium]|nr:PD-(D/E)XK nuclease family protein [Bacillota bacterium]
MSPVGDMLILPSRALANKYRRLLEGQAGPDPANILTWPDLLRLIAAELEVPSKRLLSPVEVALLVMQACRTLQPDLSYYAGIAGKKGFWQGMARFIQEVRFTGAPWQDQVTHPAKRRDIELILSKYQSLLGTTGCTDSPGRYRELAAAVREATKEGRSLFVSRGLARITVIGHQLGGVQKDLLEALADQGISWALQESIYSGSRPRELRLWKAAEPYGEVHRIGREVAGLLEAGVPLQEIAIIYPQERYLTLLRKELNLRGIPVRDYAQRPLGAFPLVSRLLAGFQSHECLKAPLADHLAGFREYVAEQVKPELWESELAENTDEDTRRLAAQEFRAVESLLQVIDDSGEVLAFLFGSEPISRSEVCRALALLVDESPLWEKPFPGPGLTCIPLGQAQSVSAKYLFFVGLSQGVLGKRRTGWLPELAEQYEYTQVIDALLAEGPLSVTLSYPATDTGGSLQLKPLYFDRLYQEGLVTSSEEIPYHRPDGGHASGAEKAVIDRKAEVERKRRSPVFTSYDGNLAGAQTAASRSGKHHFPVSRLETYLRCPFGYFAKYLLELAGEEGEIPEVQPIDEGSLIHHVLHRFFSTVETPLDSRLEPKYEALLADLLEEAIEQRKAQAPQVLPGAWQVSRFRVHNFLRGLLQEELCHLSEPGCLRPAQLEEAITPVELETSAGVAELSGRIDRIDTDGAGNWLLIDYKKGEVNRKEITECTRLQLPIYAGAWLEQLSAQGVAVKSVGVCYYSYQKAKRCLYTPKDSDQAREWLERAKSVAGRAVEGITAGRFLPLPQKADTCDSCEFPDLCRARGGLTHKRLPEESGESGA